MTSQKNPTDKAEASYSKEICQGEFSYFLEKMSNKKRVFIFLSQSWSKKFLLHDKYKSYKKLLVSSGSMVGVDKAHTQEEYNKCSQGWYGPWWKIIKLG